MKYTIIKGQIGKSGIENFGLRVIYCLNTNSVFVIKTYSIDDSVCSDDEFNEYNLIWEGSSIDFYNKSLALEDLIIDNRIAESCDIDFTLNTSLYTQYILWYNQFMKLYSNYWKYLDEYEKLDEIMMSGNYNTEHLDRWVELENYLRNCERFLENTNCTKKSIVDQIE